MRKPIGVGAFLVAAAMLAATACGDAEEATSDATGAGGTGGTGQGTGAEPVTGACGGPGQACEQSCTGMGSDADCEGCAMTHCGAEVEACIADAADGSGCLECAELLLEMGDPSQSCGLAGDACMPDTSCARFLALGECMCGEV